MSLPIVLSPGQVSIYGKGNTTGNNGITADDGFLFGVIDQIWDGGINGNKTGDSVMFYEKDLLYRLVYGGQIYTIIPQDKIGMTEQFIP